MRWPLFISAVFVSSVLSWGCRKDPPAEPEPEALPVDSGFVPARDGFGFENFAGYVRTAVFSPDAAYRMYGEPACSRVTDAGQCVLAPAMAQWSAQVNASTRGGLCEGFAVASWLGYTGQIDLSKFGDVGDGVSSLDRAAMSEIDFEIAYWFATQSLPGVIDATEGVGGARRGAHLRGTPRVNSRRLSRRDRQDGREREPRRGHAVTPYKVEVDGDKVSVYVYDSNHPSDNSRVLEIDRAADTWRYVASQNPDEPEGIYEGDTTNNNKIWLVSDKPRIGIQECDFCEGSASDTRTTNTFGAIDVTVTGGSGAELGHTDSGFSSENSAGVAKPSFSTFWRDKAPLVFRTPSNQELKITAKPSPGASAADTFSIARRARR